MNSTILKLASKYIRSLLIVFAIIALIRGHNYPGGGFIGGLLAALSLVYKVYAYDELTVKNNMFFKPSGYLSIGLVIVLLSMLPSVFNGLSFMTGLWYNIGTHEYYYKLGTPFIFDIGVFFVVIGVVLTFLFALNKEDQWKY